MAGFSGLPDYARRAGRYTSKGARVVRDFSNFLRKNADPKGVLRHFVGGYSFALFNYLPEKPAYGLVGVKVYVWNFGQKRDVVSNAIDATTYEWLQTNSGVGTPLACQDGRTGEAKFVTAAGGTSYYCYQGAQETAQVIAGKDFWFEAEVKLSAVTSGDLFVGFSKHIASGNIFDNRVEAYGIRKDDGAGTLIGEATKAGVATSSQDLATMTNDGYVRLGLRYIAYKDDLAFYINNDFKSRVRSGFPSELMAVTFAARGAANSMTVKKITFAIET